LTFTGTIDGEVVDASSKDPQSFILGSGKLPKGIQINSADIYLDVFFY
jgi:FKBP-type peptidyl-prolyl cis-trans isomerase 2